MANRTAIPKRLQVAVFRRDGWLCCWCKRPVIFAPVMRFLEREIRVAGKADPLAYHHAHWTRHGAPLLDLLGAVNRSRPSIFDWRSGPYRQPCERPGADAPHRAVRRRFWAPAGRSIRHKVTGRRRPEGRDPASGASPLLPYRLTLRPLSGPTPCFIWSGRGDSNPRPQPFARSRFDPERRSGAVET